LRNELGKLEKDANTKNAKCNELDNAIKLLEENIGIYKG
jgi:hypothetical protein